VALRKFVDRLTKPTEQLDREHLEEWCTTLGYPRLDQVEKRRPVRVGGEVRSIRIVPRAGADALEATITDGHGTLTAVFLGRRKILGVSPGRRVFLEGVVTKDGSDQVMYNPLYELA
jgi:hypothetical protein